MALANPHIYIPHGLTEAQELQYLEPFAKLLVEDKGADMWLHPLLVSNLVEVLLMGVIVTQTLAWTVRFAKKDGWLVRLLVPITFLASLCPTILHSMWAVKVFTQSKGLYAPLFEFKYEGGLFGFICPQFLPVQLYSMYTLFNLSRTRTTRALLMLLSLVLLGEVALFLTYAFSIPALSTRLSPRIIGTLEGGMIASALVSVGVAVGLVDGLRKQRAAVSAMGMAGQTQVGGMMRRGLNSLVECQAIPAIAALVLAIGIPALRHLPSVTYLLPLAKLGPASLFLTLNSRKGMRRISLAAPRGSSFLSLPYGLGQQDNDALENAQEHEHEQEERDVKGPIRLTPTGHFRGAGDVFGEQHNLNIPVPSVFVGEAVSVAPGAAPGGGLGAPAARPPRPAARYSDIPSTLPARSRIEQALLFNHESDSSAPNTPLVRQGSPSPGPHAHGERGGAMDERLGFAFQRADLSSPLSHRVPEEAAEAQRWGARREEGYFIPPSPSVGDADRE